MGFSIRDVGVITADILLCWSIMRGARSSQDRALRFSTIHLAVFVKPARVFSLSFSSSLCLDPTVLTYLFSVCFLFSKTITKELYPQRYKWTLPTNY